MIRTLGLGKQFGDFPAVTDVTLQVREGELLTLLGPNGAGKTTTVRMLVSLLRPSSGTASVAGYDVIDQPAQVRRSVGLLTEQPGLYLRMTGIDYLEFFGQLHKLERTMTRNRGLELLEQFEMGGAAHRRVGEYSKGMKQKLAIIRAMLHEPPVLMLDEPTSAMDPKSAKTVRDAILRLRDEHRTILLCTHNLAEAEMLADRIAIIRHGSIIAEGAPADLKRKLLGDPIMEVRLDQVMDLRHLDLDGLVKIEDRGLGWLRYRTSEPEITNPQILHRLANLGLNVVTLSETRQSLEQVYLHVVSNSDQEEAS